MSSDVTEKVSEFVAELKSSVRIIWHGGEPLASGLSRFSRLIEPFNRAVSSDKISHAIQTNGTLLNKDWCSFLKDYQFHVGVSLDGPPRINKHRVDWGGSDSFERVLQGIRLLKKNDIDFSIISVITEDALEYAHDIYQFFCDIGCPAVGFNIEEKEGGNTREICDNNRVSQFWSDLFEAWKENPEVSVREFDRAMKWMDAVNSDNFNSSPEPKFDIFPTVGYNGEVVLLSPEFLGAESDKYNDFTVGNILNKPMKKIIDEGLEAKYVEDSLKGVRSCRNQCPYYSFCKGGQPSNKYFELGSTNETETAYCRNSQQRPLDAFLDGL